MRLLILFFIVLAVSCKPSVEKKSSPEAPSEKTAAASISSFEGPAELLLTQLREQGDYVNSRQYPSMIKPATVFDELGEKNLIIDMRTEEKFLGGHIKGAVNMPMDKLLSYFENDIIPFKYGKIVLVCSGGQRSSYATNLLRLIGYGNVYSMRWGMCGWNSDFTGYLHEKFLSSKYQFVLEAADNPKPASVNQPFFETTSASGEEILQERISGLLAINPSDVFIKSGAVFESPENYFIINFERKDKYESGHIPGAVRYKQQGTLGIPSEMGTLPLDKTIVMYCGTGMSSSFAVAYLRLFGYDARSISYGNNSFMHQKMLDEKESLSWHPFTEDLPGEFSYVKGD